MQITVRTDGADQDIIKRYTAKIKKHQKPYMKLPESKKQHAVYSKTDFQYQYVFFNRFYVVVSFC